MSEQTNIEWADSTFNPVMGCSKVGPGCDNCYAEAMMDHRLHKVVWGPGQPRVRTSPSNWNQPLAWNKAHDAYFAEHGRRRRVFCASLADVFDNEWDPAWRVDLLELIANTPNLDWLLLTKRIGNAHRMLDEALDVMSHGLTRWDDAPWPNVWLGATVVNQEEADRDIPKLLAVPAARRFLSMEPLLGPVDLTRIDIDGHREVYPLTGSTNCEDDNGNLTSDLPALDWIIVGGESGHGARPMHPDWARDLRDQCAVAGVPFLLKQWGEWHCSADHEPDSHPMRVETMAIHYDGTCEYRPLEAFGLTHTPGWATLCRVGKKAAGRHLDGVLHDGFPEVA